MGVPVLYIDVVWALNVIMDAFILTLTAFFCRRKRAWWRIGLSAVVGAMYVVLMLWPGPAALFVIGFKIALSVLMIWVAFPFHSLKEFVVTLLVFYVASFLTGGIALALNYLVQSPSLGEAGFVVASGRPAWLINGGIIATLAACPAAYSFGNLLWRRVTIAKRRQAGLWTVSVRLGDEKIQMVGLLDTGNQLREPVSGTPVIVVDYRAIMDLLPMSLVEALASGGDPIDWISNENVDETWQSRFRVVPYRTVGKSAGLLLALRPDEITVEKDGEAYHHQRVLLGLNDRPLASDGSYQAIVHADLTIPDHAAS